MRVSTKDYKSNDLFRIIREYSGLSQDEISKLAGKKNRYWAKDIENGRNRFYFDDLCEICKKCGLNIIIEDDKNFKIKNTMNN